jgi:hypothetical protein
LTTVLTAAAALLLFTGCSPERDPASLFAPALIDVPVVDALLVIDEPLPPIYLSRTIMPDQPYFFDEAAIRNAQVQVLIDDTTTIDYAEDPEQPGVYLPSLPEPPVVAPQTLYELRVSTEKDELVHAATITPARLVIDEWVLLDRTGQTVQRRLVTFAEVDDPQDVFSAPQNQLVYTEGILEGRLVEPRAAGTQVAVSSLDLDADFVIDLPFLDDEDLAELERTGSSPALALDSEAVRLPWFGIFWEGRHVLRVLLLDRNAYDLIRTTPLGGGFSPGGNAGDGFERPIFHIEGGIGLFGSAATDSIGFTILSAPTPVTP